MRNTFFIFLLVIQGCSAISCIDAQIPRHTRAIDKEFNVELLFNGKSMKMVVHCEEYYDAMCAARGNSWNIREVGMDVWFKASTFSFNDSAIGDVEIPAPRCVDMVSGDMYGNHFFPKINGAVYWVKSSTQDNRTLVSRENEKEYVAEIRIKVNSAQIYL